MESYHLECPGSHPPSTQPRQQGWACRWSSCKLVFSVKQELHDHVLNDHVQHGVPIFCHDLSEFESTEDGRLVRGHQKKDQLSQEATLPEHSSSLPSPPASSPLASPLRANISLITPDQHQADEHEIRDNTLNPPKTPPNAFTKPLQPEPQTPSFMSLSSPIRPNISDTPELPTFDEMMASLRGSRELEDSSQQSPSTSQNSPASSRSKESVELQLIQRSADGSSDDGSDVGLQKRDALSLDPQIRGTTIPSVPMPSAAVIERLPPVHVIQPPGQMPRLSTYTFNLSPVRQAWYQPPRFTKRARTMASPHLADHSSTPPRVGQPEVESKVAAEGGLQQSQGSTQSYSQIGTFSMLQTQAPYESPRFSQ